LISYPTLMYLTSLLLCAMSIYLVSGTAVLHIFGIWDSCITYFWYQGQLYYIFLYQGQLYYIFFGIRDSCITYFWYQGQLYYIFFISQTAVLHIFGIRDSCITYSVILLLSNNTVRCVMLHFFISYQCLVTPNAIKFLLV
jgi:hypothetical protein